MSKKQPAVPEPLSTSKIKIGISSCLLGNKVRYDGQHKHDRYLTQTLGEYFDYVPFCPEAETGMGVPRPSIQLVAQPQGVRVLGVTEPDKDFTQTLSNYHNDVKERFAGLSGFVLKRGSPTCGMERVPIYAPNKEPRPPDRTGVGLFAQGIAESHPLLPVEEEGRLCDPLLRENFIVRVFVFARWLALYEKAAEPSVAQLVDFHSDHKYLIMAHDPSALKVLGQMVARMGKDDFEQLKDEYISLLMRALKKRVSRGRHANVLQHIIGYFSDAIEADDRAELVEVIDHYQQGLVPLIVPLTLIKHFIRKYPDPYLLRQVYLTPHPSELMLRNSI